MVGYSLVTVFIIKNTILVKEIEEDGGCDTFVPITETVILGNEVKEIGRFFFKGGVNSQLHLILV